MHDAERLHIALGVIFNPAKDKVLIARRPEHVHQGGLWEFPGGKLAHAENAEDALKRELSEELGLLLRQAKPLICFEHDYPALKVRLDVWTVEEWQGEPHAKEGQKIEWVTTFQLKEREFPAANRRILSAISRLHANAT